MLHELYRYGFSCVFRAHSVTDSTLIRPPIPEKAIRLLVQTNVRISEIGDAVGFGDPTSFTRSFRRRTGISPNEYRQKYCA